MAKAIVTDFRALVAQWFSEIKGVAPETIARVSQRVESKLAEGACKNMMPMAPPEYSLSYELRLCVEQVLREEWDRLSSEERLLICHHPRSCLIGEQIRLPNRAAGTVVAQELTRRLSLLITVLLPDGATVGWEFY